MGGRGMRQMDEVNRIGLVPRCSQLMAAIDEVHLKHQVPDRGGFDVVLLQSLAASISGCLNPAGLND